MPKDAKSISVILPVHNEQAILESQVFAMHGALKSLGRRYEIVVVENGSTDRTPAICQELSQRYSEIRTISSDRADYGAALRDGILNARCEVVIIFNVEFWSFEFVSIALTALETRSLVIGSKSAPGAHDDRPALRRLITKTYNGCLRLVWGFQGTDTHGMKAFHREEVVPVVLNCKCSGFVFDTELVLRCERAGLRRLELPTDVKELRAPSLTALLRRVPSVVRNLFVLWESL